MVEFYPRAPESPVQHASAFLLLSKELRQASGSQEMHLRTSKSRIIARGEWFCSSLHLGNSPLFLPRHAFLPFKARISIRTQFSDFKRSQGLQKAAVLVLLGVFWTQSSALDTFVLHEPGNDYVTGTMTIDSEKHIVEVHVNAGVYSSDSIFDYSRGYIATRLLSRHACFIMKINKDYIPELQEIGRLAFERQAMRTVYSPQNVWVQFQSGHSVLGKITDWLRYGRQIEHLCSGLPLYELTKIECDGCYYWTTGKDQGSKKQQQQ
ncbi:gastrokine-2 isoform X2 [Opisthocomus hoazin]|uniref:gastrokine-2 isoform X2 n=1 Tax=Opisthocomus hoazin TaxID=30419 RepID=UPI003F533F60